MNDLELEVVREALEKLHDLGVDVVKWGCRNIGIDEAIELLRFEDGEE